MIVPIDSAQIDALKATNAQLLNSLSNLFTLTALLRRHIIERLPHIVCGACDKPDPVFSDLLQTIIDTTATFSDVSSGQVVSVDEAMTVLRDKLAACGIPDLPPDTSS